MTDHIMTWGEFKQWVAEQDIPEDTDIWYFDFSFPFVRNGEVDLSAHVADKVGVSVQ